MTGPFFKPEAGKRVDDELEFHIEMHTRDLIARGIDPVEARRQAEASLGDRSKLASEIRELDLDIDRTERRTQYLSELAQDTRFAFRMLSRRRTFAAIAVATLTIGIGAATAIYSIVDGVLLKPLPFSEPDRVGAVWITQPELAKNAAIAWLAETTPVGNEEYQAIKAATRTLSDVALFTTGSAYVSGSEGTERILVGEVTSTIFRTLRLRMPLGRAFATGDDALNAAPIALVSWEAWQAKYHGDTSVLGKSVILDRKPHTIVGVLPKGLRLVRSSPEVPPYWVPALRDSSDLPQMHNRNYQALARLAPGASFPGASAELSRIIREVTHDSTSGARVEQWQRDESRQSRSGLFALLGAAVFLLCIACVNVAMLLLGESANRSREMAARAALGAGSGRLTRQLLVESLVIALISAACGSALSWAFMRGLVAVAPPEIPGMSDVAINLRVLAFATFAATATGLLFGVAPALAIGRSAVASLARIGTGQSNRKGALLQRTLIATQLALSTVLLTDALLLARSFHRLTSVHPGFSSSGLSIARVSMPYELFREEEKSRAVASAIQQRFAALPGVENVVYASTVPFGGGGSSSPVVVEGNSADPKARGAFTQQRYVSAGYFEAIGVRLIRGRFFNNSDNAGSTKVAIISQAEVKRDFGSRIPIGVRVRQQGQWREIVGIVADVKYRGLTTEDEATIYVPFEQHPNTAVMMLVRERRTTNLETFRRALREVEHNAVVTRVDPLTTLVANSYASERYRTVLIIAFACVAALLAAVGMYGVGTRAAARRTREVGIRLALGSTSNAIARLMLGDAMRGVLVGVGIGIPASIALGAFVQPFLYGVKATDTVSYITTALLLATVTMVASYVPSRRASRADPAAVLRGE